MKLRFINYLNIIAILFPILFIAIFPDNKLSVILCLLIFCITILFNFLTYKNQIKKNVTNKFVIYYILFLSFVSIITFLFSPYSKLSTTFLVIGGLILQLILFLSDNDLKTNFKYASKYFVIFIFICSIYSLIIRVFGDKTLTLLNGNVPVQYLKIGPIKLYQYAVGYLIGDFNVSSIFKNTNMFSDFCLFSLILNLFVVSYKNKVVKTLFSIFLTVGLLLSGSRIAILLFGLLLLFYLLFCLHYLNNKTFINIIICCIPIFVFLFFINFRFIADHLNLNGRTENWSIALKEINLYPLGINADNYLLHNKYNLPLSMHNSYLTFGVNFGLFLLVLNVLFIVLNLMLYINRLSNKYYAAIFMCFLSICTISLFESSFLVFCSFHFIYFDCLLLMNTKFNNKN